MPILKPFNSNVIPPLAAEGIFSHDRDALSDRQIKCTNRLCKTMQLEQEAYMSQHPEVLAMLEMLMSKLVHDGNRKNNLAAAAKFFTRPPEELETEIQEHLAASRSSNKKTSHVNGEFFNFTDKDLIFDLKTSVMKPNVMDTFEFPTHVESTITTLSSSFLSAITSNTTQPTPEPIKTPEPTLSETLFGMVSNTVDKAVYIHVNEGMLKYDTAYVELMKSVEEAMEIPVIDLREDLAEMLYNAYINFEDNILTKERIAAELAWEKRMRKKMKRTLRRVNNFKGYETPPMPISESEEANIDRRPPPRPCDCHPQFLYNRYPKDRFGIYLPGVIKYSDENTTTTPAFSIESIIEKDGATTPKVETKFIENPTHKS